MLVYVLTEYMIEENSQVVGVFSSREKAANSVRSQVNSFRYNTELNRWESNDKSDYYLKYIIEELTFDE